MKALHWWRDPNIMLPVAILCGGLATRLRPITASIPKSLIPVNGEPFLAHQLRLLDAAGIEKVVLCVGFLGEKIRDFASDRFGRIEISYSFDGPKLLGTAGAIVRAFPYLGPSFFVLYGDSYLPCNYRKVAADFGQSGKNGLMTVYRNEGKYDSSNVEFRGGRILRYDKKNKTPRMRYIDYGLGVFDKSAFSSLSADEPTDLASVYGRLLERNDLAASEVNERFYEIGSLEGIRDLEQYLSGSGKAS
ncbi:MAG TPA: nucleotidyltransferase family protein [Bryobacteraceae bacterium]